MVETLSAAQTFWDFGWPISLQQKWMRLKKWSQLTPHSVQAVNVGIAPHAYVVLFSFANVHHTKWKQYAYGNRLVHLYMYLTPSTTPDPLTLHASYISPLLTEACNLLPRSVAWLHVLYGQRVESFYKESVILFTTIWLVFLRVCERAMNNNLFIVLGRLTPVSNIANVLLKWQIKFNVAFIHCHGLRHSTWECDEWCDGISQRSRGNGRWHRERSSFFLLSPTQPAHITSEENMIALMKRWKPLC